VYPPVLLSGAGSKRSVSALGVRLTESPRTLDATIPHSIRKTNRLMKQDMIIDDWEMGLA
jgi:hypothetical protein